MFQSRTGATTVRSGATEAVVTSKRTWSLPLPGEAGGGGGGRYCEADLGVAVAGGAVGDVGGPDFAGGLDELLGYERASERSKERVLAAIEGVRLYGRGDVLVDELGPRVAHEGGGGGQTGRARRHASRARHR